MDLESNLVEIISSLVGDFKLVNEHRKNSNRTGVFEIVADNQNTFVKINNRLSRWNPEVYAYNNWSIALEPFVPQLMHSFNKDNYFGIIISAVEGKTINEFQLKDEKLLEKAYFKAGELLRLLHDKFEGDYFGIPSVDGTSFEKMLKQSQLSILPRHLKIH